MKLSRCQIVSSRIRLPDFLIIGSMKSGTTTLHVDLLTHDRVFLPNCKEPHDLLHEKVMTLSGKQRYAKLFQGCSPETVCGEASTQYTAYPFYKGVPRRARELLGPDVNLIYVVRNPILRTISHFRHAFLKREVDLPYRRAFASHSRLIDISRYSMQLERWLEYFSKNQIHVIRFEDYIENRTLVVSDLIQRLGLDASGLNLRDSVRMNSSDGNRLWPPWAMRLSEIGPFRALGNSLFSTNARAKIRRLLAPKPPPMPPPPTSDEFDFILQQVGPDAELLRQELGRTEALWDWEQTKQQVLMGARQ